MTSEGGKKAAPRPKSIKRLPSVRHPKSLKRVAPAERNRPYMPRASHEILFGIHPVREMLNAGRRSCHCIWMLSDQAQQRRTLLRGLVADRGIPIRECSREQLDVRCGDRRHQGVAAEVTSFPSMDLEAALLSLDNQPSPLVLALDSISDPQNLGAILRSALCTGVAVVILPKDRSARPTPIVSKASAGAMEHIQLAQVTNLASTLATLKAHGYWVAGTDAGADRSLYEAELTGPVVLVIGSEEKGLRRLVRQRCDFLLGIPQVGPVGSLNASAAAAVVLYEAFRQRSRMDRG